MYVSSSTRIVFALLIVHIVTVANSLLWNQPNVPVLPNGGRQGMIAGLYNRSIYLIGGATATNTAGVTDIIQYNIDNNMYNIHGSITSAMHSYAQSYTQIESTLHIYSSSTDYVVTYDMSSNTYDAQYALKDNINLDDPCVTNLNAEFLVLLGGSINPNYQSGFHIFNVITKQWMNDGPNMLEPRSYLTCQAHNDHLFAIGGGNAASLLDTVIMINIGNISNIAHQNWSTLADTLSQSRNLLRSALHEDDIYVIGGWSGNTLSTVYGEVDVINTQNNTISLDSVLSIVAERVSPVVAFDVLYVFGGVNLVDNELDTMQYAVLSPLIWEQSDTITLPNGGRYGMAAGFFNESVFLIGGRTASNSNGFTEVIKYNMNSDAYTAHGTITHNIRIVSQSYTQIDSMIYMYSSSTDDIVSYDMASSTYDAQYVLKANVALDDPCMTNLNSEFLFLLGGSISPNYQSGFHIFDLNTKQWINDGPDMLEPRVYFSCDTHRDHLYVMGGGNAVEALDTVIVIDIRNVSTINHQNWSALDDTLSAKKNQLHSVVFEDDIYVIGGWSTGATATPYGHIDVIDTITNTIHIDSTLMTAAYGVSPVVAVNTLYVFGGYNPTDRELDSFEYALLSPTPAATRAPSTDTIAPTQAPSNNPTTGAPSSSSTAPTTVPSNPPTAPTTAPSTNPSVSTTSAPSTNPSASQTWSESQITLPNGGMYGMISGVLNELVFLIGGRKAGTDTNGVGDVLIYNVDTNNYTVHESPIAENQWMYTQSYTQMDSTLYIYSVFTTS
eukprot:305540_1